MTYVWNRRIRMMAAIGLALAFAVWFGAASAHAQIDLHTSYSEISVPPGESIRYSVDVVNSSDQSQNVRLDVIDAPDGWDWTLRAGGWDIQQVRVKPGDEMTVNLEVDVPLQIEAGTYRFELSANGGESTLPLIINVSESGTFQSELSTDQPNMEGHADSNFTFKLNLRNRTAEEQLYALRAGAPSQGWDIRFIVDAQRVTSVPVEPNATQSVTVDVTPPQQVEAGTYTIPIQASNSNTSAEVELEVVISGTYGMELTTPEGLLSYDIRAGKEKRVEFVIKNTGSAELENISLSSGPPANWEVVFDSEEIDSLPAGESTTVQATITAAENALPGDYITSISASSPEVNDKVELRMTVQQSVLWGWIGVLIILAVLGGIYYLFRTYGRR